MKRWFITKLIDTPDGRVPKSNQYTGLNTRIWSKPGFDWAVGQMATTNAAQFDLDTELQLFPDTTLDMTWSSVPAATRTKVLNFLTAAGFQTNITGAMTIREVLNYLVNQIQFGTNIEAGDVPDV